METTDFQKSKTIKKQTNQANKEEIFLLLKFEPVLGSKPVDTLSFVSM